VEIPCPQCQRPNHFAQPHLYHAGFGDQGFLYDDAGHLTLTWSIYDPIFERYVGKRVAWDLSAEERRPFEDALKPAPSGGRWRFENPARCLFCGAKLLDPIGPASVYYVLYPDSIVTSPAPFERSLVDLVDTDGAT
jgi:hypothetical protein